VQARLLDKSLAFLGVLVVGFVPQR